MPRVPTTTSAQPTAVKTSVLQKQRAYSLEQTGTRQGNAVQANARSATAQSRANPFADGNLKTDIAFVANVAVVINHGLGRPYQGYLLLRVRNYPGGASNPALVIEIAQAANLNAAQISITPQGTFVADVWVY